MEADSSAPNQPARKYRSSCDSCQACKVKCGQEKPVCHRCSVQELECVYSLSRRMGRPRQKHKDAAAQQAQAQAQAAAAAAAAAPTQQLDSPPRSPMMRDVTTTTNSTTSAPSPPTRDAITAPSPPAVPLHVPVPSPPACASDMLAPELQATLDGLDFASFRAHLDMPGTMDCDSQAFDMSMYNDADTASLFNFGPPQVTTADEASHQFTAPAPAMSLGSPIGSCFQNMALASQLRLAPPAAGPLMICDCYTTVLGSLTSSKSHHRDVSIDAVLDIQNDTQLMLSDLLKCRNCSRDACVQLLAIVSVSTVLKLLRRTAHGELKPQRSSPPAYTARPGSQGQHQAPADCDLYVGKFKVADETRVRFLRSVFQSRMRRLSADLESVHSNLGKLPPDGISKAAITVADDTFSGLHTIAGWMELWDC